MVSNDEILAMGSMGAGAVLEKKREVKFMHRATKSHCMIAGEMAEKIKAVILAYEDKIPLALAVGVLEVVKKEIIEDNN